MLQAQLHRETKDKHQQDQEYYNMKKEEIVDNY